MDILWHGPISGQSGYEVITREILIALDKMGVRVHLDEAINWNLEKIELPEDVKGRFTRMAGSPIGINAPVIMHQKMQPLPYSLAPGAKVYIYSLFETDRLPESWRDDFEQATGIFTFSNFNRDAWIESGIDGDKIHVLPHGINPAFRQIDTESKILNKKGFTFLSNGDFTERKNFEALIEAYVSEFKASEPVTLIIKAHYGGFSRRHQKILFNRIRDIAHSYNSNPPRILFAGEKYSQEDLVNLYNSVDCYVTASRGEGLCLPVLEAMACGLPIIATNWSALSELGFSGSYVSYSLKTIDSVDYITKCPHALNHKWVNVCIPMLGSYMRDMFTDQDTAKQCGNENAEAMKRRSWHSAATSMMKILFNQKGAE